MMTDILPLGLLPPIEYFGVMIPILVMMIPIIAIVMGSLEKMHANRLRHSSQVSSAEWALMKQRFSEMEQRIQTLQEIVIGTDYEARRKIEMAERSLHSSPTGDPHDARQRGIVEG